MNATQTCYRHPDRETNVSCSNCGRPICTDCMTPSPVGMRCPECSKERQKVVTRAGIDGRHEGIEGFWRDAPVSFTLMAINVIVFLAEIATGFPLGAFGHVQGTVMENGVFFGPLIANGDWWRVITPGFLHLGLIHIALNMYMLYVIGRMIEPALGTARMIAIYGTSLVAGSLGAMILDPGTPSAGASGAIFGMLGVALVIAWSRGIRDAYQQIAILIGLNLVLTFGVSSISKGAHVGGLIGGLVCGLVLFELGEKRGIFGRGRRSEWIGTVVIALIGIGCFAATILLARHHYPQFVGVQL